MSIELIAKIAPKNDGFVGMVDGRQVIISAADILATVDGAADYFLVLDDTDGTVKRVLGENLPGGGGGGGRYYVDQSGGASDTHGALSGTINGSNTTFTVSQAEYISGTLMVWVNGQLLIQGTSEGWIETTPGSGIFDFNTAPIAGDEISVVYLVNASVTGDGSRIDQSGGTSDTYGILSGTINGSNTTFTLSAGEYISGTLKVSLNGQIQTQGSSEDWVETSPGSGTFDFNTAPIAGDEIFVEYKVSGTGSGDADTLDGEHATAFQKKTGWNYYDTVIPTRTSADDPIYVISFAGVDLTGEIGVGDFAMWTQNSTVRYGIVHAIAFSTNTTITIYGGSDYDVDDTGSYAISDFAYSHSKSPHGFPLDPDKWSEEAVQTSYVTKTTPVQNTWYNAMDVGNLPSLDMPIGKWYSEYTAHSYFTYSTTGGKSCQASLSTSSSSESDSDLTDRIAGVFGAATGTEWRFQTNRGSKVISAAVKTTHYIIIRTQHTNVATIGLDGAAVTTRIRFRSAYL